LVNVALREVAFVNEAIPYELFFLLGDRTAKLRTNAKVVQRACQSIGFQQRNGVVTVILDFSLHTKRDDVVSVQGLDIPDFRLILGAVRAGPVRQAR
jgi:hypothetical protein